MHYTFEIYEDSVCSKLILHRVDILLKNLSNHFWAQNFRAARGYLLARRLHFVINRIFDWKALTDFSNFWHSKQRMFDFYKTCSLRANKTNVQEIQGLF